MRLLAFDVNGLNARCLFFTTVFSKICFVFYFRKPNNLNTALYALDNQHQIVPWCLSKKKCKYHFEIFLNAAMQTEVYSPSPSIKYTAAPHFYCTLCKYVPLFNCYCYMKFILRLQLYLEENGMKLSIEMCYIRCFR